MQACVLMLMGRHHFKKTRRCFYGTLSSGYIGQCCSLNESTRSFYCNRVSGRSFSAFCMGAGASAFPVGHYKHELLKPQDGSDLLNEDFAFVQSEARRLLQELAKYVEDPSTVGVDLTLADICRHDTEEENFKACVQTVSHIRRLLHKTTSTANREKRKRLSAQGKALFAANFVENSDEEEADDAALMDMSQLRK